MAFGQKRIRSPRRAIKTKYKCECGGAALSVPLGAPSPRLAAMGLFVQWGRGQDILVQRYEQQPSPALGMGEVNCPTRLNVSVAGCS